MLIMTPRNMAMHWLVRKAGLKSRQLGHRTGVRRPEAGQTRTATEGEEGKAIDLQQTSQTFTHTNTFTQRDTRTHTHLPSDRHPFCRISIKCRGLALRGLSSGRIRFTREFHES